MQGRRNRTRTRAWALALACACSPVASPASEETRPASNVELDRLLKLPRNLPPPKEEERKGGRTRLEWQERFDSARGAIEEHRTALDKAVKELQEEVGGQGSWQMAAPGMPAGAAEDTPASFELREEIRRQRVEVARAERRLRDLEVEASLAGVPPDWLREDDSDGAPREGADAR